MFLIITILFFTCFYKLLTFFKKTEGLLSTFSIFSITFIFYNVLIPLECYLLNDYTMYGTNRTIVFTEGDLVLIMVFNLLGIIGFSLGYKWSRFNPYSKIAFNNEGQIAFPIGITILGFIGIICILLFFKSELAISNSYEGNYTTTYENPIYALLIKFFLVFIGSLIAFSIYKKNKITITSIILLIIGLGFGLYSSSKSQLLLIVTGGLSYFVINPPKSTRKFILVIASIFFFMAVINVAFGYYRFAKGTSYTVDDLSNNSINILRDGFFKSTDARGPMYVLGTELNKTDEEYQYGASYVQIFSLLIPKAIWPERPYDLAEEFARNNMSNWSSGQGLGYSFILEGYVNFGIIGVLLHYILWGYIWGRFWGWFKNIIITLASTEYWYSFYFTLGTYIVFLSHRTTLAGSLKTMMLYILPFLVFLWIFKQKKKYNESAVGT